MLAERQSSGPAQFERNWAMLAHLTVLLTVVAGLATGGAGAVIALLAPLGLAVYFSGRSPYVAFHALQTTAFQAVVGIVFVVAAAAAGGALAVMWAATALLSAVLVGLLLVPFALGLTLLAALGLLALAGAGLALPLRGAYLTYTGQPFEYPWLGEVVARTMEAPVSSPPTPA
jgi:uncharacterized Tic20 family protein